MHENNKIQAGYIILTDGSGGLDKPTYRVAIRPDNIIFITSHCGWKRCNAKVCVKSGDDVSAIETFDEIMQLIEEYNKQHKANSNYE